MSELIPHAPSLQTVWDRVKRRRSLDDASGSRQEVLLAQLASIGSLRVDRVDLPGTEVTLRIARTADFNRLLDVAVADPKQTSMPFWAEIWPSGVVLAGMIVREPDALRGKRVLELGPGVGVTAVAAMYAGADLTVADYAPGSLTLTALNALDQVGHEPHTLLVNWRDPGPALFAAAGVGFAIVLLADVLYEQKDVNPLDTLLERIVAPGGEVWIAEPGRDAAESLLEKLRERGWHGSSEACASARPDPNDRTRDVVTVHRLRRPPG
jgi:predicted nicotinamide N-methyase